MGMRIDSNAFIELCGCNKNCRSFTRAGKFAECENPRCFLSNWYKIRYKGEGHHWEDMHYNTQDGCFCFEDMRIYGCCPVREKQGSACSRVIDIYPRPD